MSNQETEIEMSQMRLRDFSYGRKDSFVDVDIEDYPTLLSESVSSESCCIFGAPNFGLEFLGGSKPNIQIIGPYNLRNYESRMQRMKWRYLGSLISQTKQNGVTYQRLLETVAKMEKQIKDSYHPIPNYLDHDELCEIMVQDGCFIIELFYMVERLVAADPFLSITSNFTGVACDLLRFDNQIPYFVLQALFDMTISPLIKENTTTLAKLALEFFNYVFPRNKKLLEKHYSLQPKHLLDLLRLSLIPETLTSLETTQNDSQIFQKIPSAKKLHEAGFA